MNDDIETRLRQALDQRVEALDAATRTRLRHGRQAALAAARPERRFPGAAPLLAGGLALALLLVGVLAWRAWQTPPVPPALEDLEMLASGEELDLYRDLDFYLWLEQEVGPEAGGGT